MQEGTVSTQEVAIMLVVTSCMAMSSGGWHIIQQCGWATIVSARWRWDEPWGGNGKGGGRGGKDRR